ncbi:MAG: hypothetical protein M3R67_09220, partial [Acidobacteriota bacterium]|nr:hypothetical protein [Acidobacteriota bacterium]
NSDPREPRIQLWLAPRGTPPPELTKYENKTDNFSGLFDQHEKWDSIAYGEGGTGPPIPDVSLPSFIDILKKQQDSVAYVVSFNGSDAAPGAWRRVAQLESEEFASGGVEPSRVKIIYGGPDKETKIQLWILPKTAPPPVMDAGPEPLPEKTIQIGSFSDYDVAEERGERWAFKGFVDVLRSKDDLRACIIVRLESDDSQENSESEPAEELVSQEVTAGPPESVEIPRADILKLIEKWRSELAETYKIREDRFIVLFATPPKYSGNSLETWIVPSGAPLPDPDAEPAEVTPEEPVEPATGEGVIQPDDVKSDKIGIDQTQPDKPRKSDPPQLLLPNT